ncbi:helix-turn-helix transcriptional regulator [uncultured Jannaschia sp.]|uniref:helix-turn-helix domain-containing protein n=1 Tax=uncultured Jannaschia sp. TaxID=293347 RepID=UPI00260C181E|nr:helix-turn-helix transcriptional regulator [uncultured Jannaschia sp.]
MARSLRSPGHLALMQVLRETRQKKGLTQADLAARLTRPQSYVAKIEGGERRLDVVEFLDVAVAMDRRPADLIDEIVERMERSTT